MSVYVFDFLTFSNSEILTFRSNRVRIKVRKTLGGRGRGLRGDRGGPRARDGLGLVRGASPENVHLFGHFVGQGFQGRRRQAEDRPFGAVPGLEAGKLVEERMVVWTGAAAPVDSEPRAVKLLSHLAKKGLFGVLRNTAQLNEEVPEYSAAELDFALGAWEADGRISIEGMFRWQANGG